MRMLEQLKPLSLLMLRLGLGLIFVFYGYPMLFTNAHATAESFAKLGLPFPMSYIVGIIEFFGGALLVAGLFTRVAALSLAGVMAGAIWKVHLGKGLLAVGEYQFALIVGLAAFTLATIGPGPISLDRAVLREGAGGGKSGGGAKPPRAKP
jgi:putative oxidoreductase